MTNRPDCEAVQIAAMAVSDGETPLLTETHVQEHTDSCPTCRNDVARRQRPLLPVGLSRPHYPADLWPAIKDRLAARENPTLAEVPKRKSWRLVLSIAAALLLMIAGATWMFLNRDGQHFMVNKPSASPTACETSPMTYEIPFDAPENVDEEEYRKKFAVYFDDDFQRKQAQRLGDDADVNRLHLVTIMVRAGPLGTLFLDQKGDVVLAVEHPFSTAFHEGFAAVGTDIDERQGRRVRHFGFIDRTGQLAIPANFDGADQFSEGLAAVVKDGKYGYIDTRGKMVIASQYRLAEPFQDGIARVWLAGRDNYNLVQFIDRTGKVLRSGDRWDGRFSEGLLYVNWPGRPGFDSGRARGYVDRDFEFVFRLGEDSSGFWPARCEEFQDGMAAVEVGGSNQWAFIDRKGTLAVPGPFNQVQPFSEGRAVVSRWNELDRSAAPLWGYIDRHGEFIISPRYLGATSYKEGLAAVLLPLEDAAAVSNAEKLPVPLPQVKWGYIDVAGRTRIAPRFYRAAPFENGLALVSENPYHKGFIDKTGAYVWQVTQPAFGPKPGGGKVN
ncbi:MAG: WG repeat-containing protein [Pirellulaceae bacterium]